MDAGLENLSITRGTTWPGLRALLADGEGQPVDLTGCTPRAQIRYAPGKPQIHDLAPELGEEAGEVVVPEISDETTLSLPLGKAVWDLVIEDNEGRVWGPYLAGQVTFTSAVTQS